MCQYHDTILPFILVAVYFVSIYYSIIGILYDRKESQERWIKLIVKMIDRIKLVSYVERSKTNFVPSLHGLIFNTQKASNNVEHSAELSG